MSVLDVKYNQEMTNFVLSVIMEQTTYDYDKDDYVDIGISTFKDWLKETKNLTGKYPFGYLKNKYGEEFIDFLYTGHENDKPSYRSIIHSNPENWGRLIVKYGVVSDLPTLAKKSTFMETYSRYLPRIVNMLKLPTWIKIEFTEPNPYQVFININVDFPEMIKSNTTQVFTSYEITTKLKDFLERFLGLEFGKVVDGKVLINRGPINLNGLDEWIKNVFNKELKKEFKNLPNVKDLHSISLKQPNDLDKTDIKVTTKRGSSSYKITGQIRDLLTSKGYNPRYLSVNY
jgi:hypothetical protein